MNYIGIDIGDGESCVCYLPAGSDIEPRPLTLTGKQSFISAVAEKKIDMIKCHESQIGDLDYVGMIMGLAAYRGRQRGMEYAEAYYSKAELKAEKRRHFRKKIKKFIK